MRVIGPRAQRADSVNSTDSAVSVLAQASPSCVPSSSLAIFSGRLSSRRRRSRCLLRFQRCEASGSIQLHP
eukprot:7286062-Pyramimonas_sp.AAC.1